MKTEKKTAIPGIKTGNLTCNYLHDPLGVETQHPRLAWVLKSEISNLKSQISNMMRQTAYRVLVAKDEKILAKGKGDLWDSGKVKSSDSCHIFYKGKKLSSRQRCFWKVQVWDGNGKPSEWSETASWDMGLLSESDWVAKWIRREPTMIFTSVQSKDYPPPAPYMRRQFKLKGQVESARVYVSGLGYYELYVNGKKSGDEVLSPAFSKYDQSFYYQTRDVASLLKKGENVLGVVLGTGWYDCHTAEVWDFKQAPWRHVPKLLLQLHVKFKDGTETVVCSDEEWKAGAGPILFDALRSGEKYDARLEMPGWAETGFDDSSWKPAILVAPPGGVPRSQQMNPIRVTQTLKPVSIKQVKEGVWVYDIGQNISGWARIKVKGPAGTTVTMKYAERIKVDGDIDQENIASFVKTGETGDAQTDRYILKGQGEETWEPRFTYHGFQYVQVTGFPGTPTLENLEARVVHTDFETRGEFSCSNKLLNDIQRCARWATLSNYHGIPTDCPHREKNGWTGDASLSAEQVIMNFDPMTAYAKWMQDMRDCQRRTGQLPGIVPTGGWGFNWGSGPAWDSASILIPWYMYVYCGDLQILRDHYESMKKYVDYLENVSPDGTVQFGLGDWCPPEGGAEGHKCPAEVTNTGYYHIDAVVLAETAKLLGKKDDAKRYQKLADKIRGAFRKRYIDAGKHIVKGDSQTSYSCALYQGLVEGGDKAKYIKQLVRCVEDRKRHIDCGILGAKYVMHALNDEGRADLAYAIATQTDYPSWGQWIKMGATTLWEDWGGVSSRNHHMFSDISAWFYKGLAGINPDPKQPGFKNIIIKPNPVGDLTWVKAWHRSMYGRIECNWERDGNKFSLSVTVPVNCTADIHLPTSGRRKIVSVGAGTHRFESEI